MFGSNVIEVFLGLILIYLVLSIITSTITEGIAHFLNMRGQNLYQAIERMLNDPNMLANLYKHPLITSMSTNNERKPSYIPPHTFVNILLQMLVADPNGKGTLDAQTQAALQALDPKDRLAQTHQAELQAFKASQFAALKTAVQAQDKLLGKALQALLADADQDIEIVRKNIETWFNDNMERASGWYKASVGRITVGIALLLALLLNVDSVYIFTQLANNPSARAIIVDLAEDIAVPEGSEASVNGVPEIDTTRIQKEFERLQLLGWPTPIGTNAAGSDLYDPADGRHFPQDTQGAISRIIGWVITMAAITFGAPFWFDLLNKLVNLRSTGKPVSTQPENSTSNPASEKQVRGQTAQTASSVLFSRVRDTAAVSLTLSRTRITSHPETRLRL